MRRAIWSSIKSQLIDFYLGHKSQMLRRKIAEKRRKKAGNPHQITVYLRINDPHSYLLLQVLSQLKSRFDVQYDFRTVFNLQSDMYPAPELWRQQAFTDTCYLAQRYGLKPPQHPTANLVAHEPAITAQLLHWELQPGYLQNALAVFDDYWQNRETDLIARLMPEVTGQIACYQHHLLANEAQLKHSGHYLSAMMHYGGEWYWGLNRLQYLERRLNSVLQVAQPDVIYDRAHRDFCRLDAAHPAASMSDSISVSEPVVLYWSIRSPYSYLGLVRLQKLCQHYNVTLVVKPVLPMVMRRMAVPKNKRQYILFDAKREADQMGIAFGRICDPLGKGVERCYALFDYAQEQGKGIDFLVAYARAVWSQGIDSASDFGLRQIVQSVGLDWHKAQVLLHDESWRLWAQDNLAEMYGEGLWGVPSMTFAGTKLFGQDRIDALEHAIVAAQSTAQ